MCSSCYRIWSICTVLLVAVQAGKRIKRQRKFEPQRKSEMSVYSVSQASQVSQPSSSQTVKPQYVINFKEKINTKRRKVRSVGHHYRWKRNVVPDPHWDAQVYLREGTSSSIGHNVMAVWEKGFTGYGITVLVIDDGLKITHKEIEQRYIAHASYDFITNSTQLNHSPEGHGTKCAGVIAGSKNNLCGIGVAFDANIAGIRLIDKKVALDENEAKAFSPYKPHKIDIFSNSWGISEFATEVRGPQKLAQEALKKGVTEGRHGLGSIYVFAAGNGGIWGDSCAFNGYVNSIYTIAVSAVTKNGGIPRYSVPCAAIMTCAYAENLVTAKSSSDAACDTQFNYTSAATALTSGIIALALQANQNLTWRDIQHLIARSCDKDVIKDDDPRWIVNAAGFKVSERVGFGVLNALKFVENAQNWTHASPKQIKCELAISSRKKLRRGLDIATVNLHVNDHVCVIEHLEHVQLKVDLDYERRGLLAVDIISPKKTKSRMLHPRVLDIFAKTRNYTNWTTTSVQFWGERSVGRWLIIFKNALPEYGNGEGTLFHMSLILHGTKTNPDDVNHYDGDDDGDDDGGKKDNHVEPTTLAKDSTTETNIQKHTIKVKFILISTIVTSTVTILIAGIIILTFKRYNRTNRQARQESVKRDNEESKASTPIQEV